MADSDEEDKIGDIDSPEDLPRKASDGKTSAVLVNIGK